MSFVSYAQNFEDVMLWRALKHVAQGFYIDIGAQDPLVDSVSLAFYEHGWRGCHVEPTAQYSAKLRQARPDETVLQLAVGSQPGSIGFFEFVDTGLSTSDRAIALAHSERGYASRETLVPVISLGALLDQFGEREIHWLKVDVEGGEKSVLQSWGDSPVRPWILVIESTVPTTRTESHAEWENLVIERGYRFAYFDGLNRYYVSVQHGELAASFLVPPNIFDDFELNGGASQPFCRRLERMKSEVEARAREAEFQVQRATARAEQAEIQVQQAELKARELERRAQAADAAADHWRRQADEWHGRVLALHRSTSWTVTKPLRALRRLAGGDVSIFPRLASATELAAKQTLRPVLVEGVRQVFRRPKLRATLSPLLKKTPWLHERLLRAALNGGAIQGGSPGDQARPRLAGARLAQDGGAAMTPRARQVYADLKAAIARNQGLH